MEINEEILKDIKRLAAAAYTPKQVAFALGLNQEKFIECMQNENHPAAIAFFQGLNTSELLIRESVFQLARSGSSPAQTLSLKIFDETRKTLKREGLNESEV
jgi:hypothetical protein